MIKVNYPENESPNTNENKETNNLLRVKSKHNTYNENSSYQIDN